ncbi:MAG: hypothetical protein ISS15_19665 [Alphaproteobacteria bacterium]|nr:hypothetical protein [Alphaproteobacteria bacterium]MBL7099882.1 hypothetical protein [Alphaproteobacteria bacterium]
MATASVLTMGFVTRRVDIVHLALLSTALVVSYALPFELLLLSYAILGPAHYFTEINWLYDRKFFLPMRALAVVPLAAGVTSMFITDGYLAGIMLWLVLLACAIFAAAKTTRQALMLSVIALAATVAMVAAQVPFVLAAVLLPTFIHVCIFTLIFMTLGALRAQIGVQLGIVAVYLIAIALILAMPPSERTVIPPLARIGEMYFGGVAPALGQLVGVPDLQFGGRITGLLSFVYTYHYLNWFIKADVIRWAAIPRGRLIAIAGLSAASTALYFYDYEIGLAVLLFVSLTHVLLEFPLNGLSMVQLVTFRRSAA